MSFHLIDEKNGDPLHTVHPRGLPCRAWHKLYRGSIHAKNDDRVLDSLSVLIIVHYIHKSHILSLQYTNST
jgi:hypothetical protein